MKIELLSLSVINDLKERLSLITPDQIAACGRRHHAKTVHDKEIGIIEADGTRALCALWKLLEAEAALETARADGAVEEEIEKSHREQHSILDNLSDVARELWWTQAKMDVGFYQCLAISIRQGWVLVSVPSRPPGIEILGSMLSGGLPNG